MALSSDDLGPFSIPRTAPFRPSRQGVRAVVEGWLADSALSRNIVLHEQLPAQPAREVPIPAALAPQLRAALQARGIERLYTHQAEAC
jgi:DEAD/DEAH box helicase domain-containing protein